MLWGLSYRTICRWLLFELGLEVPKRGHAEKQVQLPLLPNLGSLSRRYRVHRGQMLLA